MSYTQQVTVASTQATQIVAQSDCRQVTIGEDPSVVGWPTTDFLIPKPAASNTPRRVSAGGSYTFQGAFRRGDSVGLVKTVTGSTTFFQDES